MLFAPRLRLEDEIFAWICRRADGTEDGFAELNPESRRLGVRFKGVL